MRWTQEQVDDARARMGGEAGRPNAAKPSKLGNVRISWQGQVFDSKRELKRYQEFEQQRALGAIRAVIRQVSLPLPGTRRRIRVDFLVVENGGQLRWFDAKGFETQWSKLKRDQIREAYGIEIELC